MRITDEAVERIKEVKNKLDPKWVTQFEEKISMLKVLAGEAKLHLHVDNEPLSFLFYIESMNGSAGLHGGLTFHGNEELGYRGSNSIQMVPQYGFSIHT